MKQPRNKTLLVISVSLSYCFVVGMSAKSKNLCIAASDTWEQQVVTSHYDDNQKKLQVSM